VPCGSLASRTCRRMHKVFKLRGREDGYAGQFQGVMFKEISPTIDSSSKQSPK